MAQAITVSDVREIVTTSLPDAVIEGYITYIDNADACLDANSVPLALQKELKRMGVAHLVDLQQQGGAGVKSLSGPLGDSITYDNSGAREEATYWGQTLQTIDQYGCVSSLLVDRGAATFLVIDGLES